MKAITPEQMREIDRLAIEEFGIPGLVLMECAALAVFREIANTIVPLSHKRILVFAGKGNNGGDAFAVARHLSAVGAWVTVCATDAPEAFSRDCAAQFAITEKMGIPRIDLCKPGGIVKAAELAVTCDLIVDGIFGTGLRDDVGGVYRDAIDVINRSGKPVLSIDIPSGICGLTGRVLGECARASKTVTLCMAKTGLIVNPGFSAAGELVIADIGIPKNILEDVEIRMSVLEADEIARLIPPRKSDSNKGDYGRVLIVTGSTGMTGAGCLAGKAALRTGAGLAYLGVPASLAYMYNIVLPEAVVIPLDDARSGVLSVSAAEQILARSRGMNVIALGPGLSTAGDIRAVIASVIASAEIPLVLDADALNALVGNLAVLTERRAEIVITPHPGEMSRLMNVTVAEIQKNRIECARDFAAAHKIIVVLKGERTVIASPDGRVFVNPTGNSGLASAGTGDVLCGVIASLIAQGASPLDAAKAGVYVHGLAGNFCASRLGEYGMIAGDLVEELPLALCDLVARVD